ncbi:MAG: isoleucine--tRNA ligase [Chlamydiota bacterium]
MFDRLNESFPQREERILAFWEREKVFEKSMANRKEAPLFSIYDGPPFATGLPHYGHLLAGTIKDVVPRYQTMRGFRVPRRFGWDCHGLPVENEIEKAKELSGAAEIEHFGIEAFNEECRSIVLRYVGEWKKTVQRMGRWVDFEKTYKTMDRSFMESVWWVFKELWKKDLVYQGFKVMPFSAQLGTPLSNFEANLNYRDVDDPSIVVTLPLVDDPTTALLIWTTTPWTLPSNLAAVVNEKLEYVKVWDRKKESHFIVGKGVLQRYFNEDFDIVATMLGTELKGKKYRPPFDYFISQASERAFTVLADDFVGEEEGTGIVHAAPAFGEADFFVCLQANIELVCPVDQNGKFTAEIPEYAGQFVKDADRAIIRRLKEMGRMFEAKQIRHRYPFCWRSDTPLIYKAVRTWFVAVEKIKEKMIQANDDIHWVPGHLKKGRFGKWLENARDWAISRNRYWGTPIPIWQSEDGETVVIGSVDELEKQVGSKVTDLHRHFVDDLSFERAGKRYTRIPEVFDCWFESGSMPYAQNHYPFENHEETLAGFPAQFVAEGLDQTRGWFYTLNVLSTALFKQPAFRHVIVNGIVLAEDGTKMSKRLKNYPEPKTVIDRYGADAIRLYLLRSPAMAADDVRFAEAGVELVLRQALIPFWNAYVFLSTYAEIDHWTPASDQGEENLPGAAIDRWILSRLQWLIAKVERGMEQYVLNEAVEPIVAFIDQLTNWYIRRNRTRFWAEEDSLDRREAFATLYRVLLTLAKITAPFIPFLSDAIYLELRCPDDPISAHLCDFPSYDGAKRNEPLELEMAAVQEVVSMGHALRKTHKFKVRQPLPKAILITADETALAALKRQEEIILAELNVKTIDFHQNEDDFVTLEVKPNFRLLGKKVGPLMRSVQTAIRGFGRAEIDQLFQGQSVVVTVEGKSIELTSEDVAIERKVKEGMIAKTQGSIAIALDTTLNEDLIAEGFARELVNKINTQRRNSGFAVMDRIKMTLETTAQLQKHIERYRDYISSEVLAIELCFGPTKGVEWDINGEKAIISLERILVK